MELRFSSDAPAPEKNPRDRQAGGGIRGGLRQNGQRNRSVNGAPAVEEALTKNSEWGPATEPRSTSHESGAETAAAYSGSLRPKKNMATSAMADTAMFADGVITREPSSATDTAMATNAMWKTNPCASSAESEPPRRRDTPANSA